MPTQFPTVSIPAYCLHKRKNLAYVRLSGDFVYLGPYGSPESKAEYERVVAEWLSRGRTPKAKRDAGSAASSSPDGISVNEVLLAYWKFVLTYYVAPDGRPGVEQQKVASAIKPVRALYGETPAANFGPVALKVVREKMIQDGLCRNTVNQRIGCVKRCFKWAVGEELIPSSVFHGLQAVDGLRRGRSAARETEPVKPVPDAHVDAVLPFLPPTVRAMVAVQRLTGMRSGEVCILRTRDLDRTGPVWLYRPATHKTAHHGHQRVVQVGPQAQAALAPLIKPDQPDA